MIAPPGFCAECGQPLDPADDRRECWRCDADEYSWAWEDDPSYWRWEWWTAQQEARSTIGPPSMPVRSWPFPARPPATDARRVNQGKPRPLGGRMTCRGTDSTRDPTGVGMNRSQSGQYSPMICSTVNGH